MKEKETKLYPLMPLRDIVIFPHMVAPLVVGRTRSIEALEDAMEKRTEIFLVTQKESKIDDPTEEELHTVGTLAVVMQLLRLPDGSIKALVEGKQRARIISFVPSASFVQVEVQELPESEKTGGQILAYDRELRKIFDEFCETTKKLPKEVVKSVNSIEKSSKLVDVICAHLPLKTEEKQEILECDSLALRMEKVMEFIQREIEVSELERDINEKVKKRMGKIQRNYYLGEKARVIQREMG